MRRVKKDFFVYGEDDDRTEIYPTKAFLGECLGVILTPRGAEFEDDNDRHVMVTIVSEDDGNWHVSTSGFSSYWNSEIIEVLQAAEKWMSKNCRKAIIGGGYVFKP